MSESASLPDVLAAVTLGPEDRLVLIAESPIAPEQHKRIQARVDHVGLTGRVLIGYRMDALVLRATKAEGSTVGQCGDFAARLWYAEAMAADPSLPSPRLDGPSHTCHLAYGHTGMHSDGDATWSNDPPIQLQPEAVPHGYTSHGHPCCGDAVVGDRPSVLARCGGAALCKACAADAARIHEGSQR